MEGEDRKDGQLDPSLIFTKSVMEQIQKEDVLSMVLAQREMLMRYEKTNEMLLNFNMLSSTRYETTMLEFKKHTNLLYEMKKDLDAIFRRIRLLKSRLSSLHPVAFNAVSDVYNVLDKDEENSDEKEGSENRADNKEECIKSTEVSDDKSAVLEKSEALPVQPPDKKHEEPQTTYSHKDT